MWEDPIVAEVHRAREKLAADCNYDIAAFFADVRKRQASLGARLVAPKKHRESIAGFDGSHHSGSSGSAPSGETPAA
jgi:hypothetical protein